MKREEGGVESVLLARMVSLSSVQGLFGTDVVHVLVSGKETGTSSWAAPMQSWWFFIRPVLQLSLGHCSWKAGLQTLFPPLLPSEIYIYIYIF